MTHYQRNLQHVLIACAILCALVTCGPAKQYTADAPLTLTILHVNDTHAHIEPASMKLKNIAREGEVTRVEVGGFARLKTFVERIRGEETNTILLHAGDVFSGTIYFVRTLGLSDLAVMKDIGFDAMAVGNHEFDKGASILANFAKKAKETFPLLGANVDASKDNDLRDIILPYTIKEYDGTAVGIIGVDTPETKTISSPGDTVAFLEPAPVVRKAIAELEERGVNKIIVLSHLGLKGDIALASNVSGIDVIVGGHSHSLLGESFAEIGLSPRGPYPLVLTNGKTGEEVLCVQAWEWANVVGRLDVTFDKKGTVVSYTGKPTLLLADTFRTAEKEAYDEEGLARIRETIASLPFAEIVVEDDEAKAIIDHYKQDIEVMKKEVVGTVTAPLLHVRIPGTTNTASGVHMPQGSEIAPHIARAYLRKVRGVGQDVAAAIINAGGVRCDIPKGPFTKAKIYELLPFNNTLFLIDLTGKEIVQSLEDAIDRVLTTSAGPFPYVAGMRYEADESRPYGKRVANVVFVNEDGTETAIDDDSVYRIVTLSFMAMGGDGYTVFKNVTRYRYDTGFIDASSFMEYVEEEKTLTTNASGSVVYRNR